MESATGIRSAVGWRKVGDVVELMEAAVLLGNGGQRDGMAITCGAGPAHGGGAEETSGVRGGQVPRARRHRAEYEELVRAVERETPERVRDEALDVAVTALRLWAGEQEA
mgnify:CR=1 FL=1